MGRHLSLLLVAAMVLALGQARADDAADDRKAIQGTWEVTEFILNGLPVKEQNRVGVKFVFDGDAMKLTGPGGIGERSYKFSLDPTQAPKTIDTVPDDGPFKGKTGPAIYELKGDAMRLCIPNKETNTRPKEFVSIVGSNLGLFVLKRSK